MEDGTVLILAPVGRDGPAAAEIFARIGVEATICTDYDVLIDRLGPHCLAVVATEEGLFGRDLTRLTGWIQDQPAWSAIPVIIFTSRLPQQRLADSRTRLVASFGNVTLLERSVKPITLTSPISPPVSARERHSHH